MSWVSWVTRQKQRLIDYKNTFNSEHGRRVLYDMCKDSFVVNDLFSRDPLEMAYREGQRATCLRLLKLLNLTPKDVEEMMIEEEEADGL